MMKSSTNHCLQYFAVFLAVGLVMQPAHVSADVFNFKDGRVIRGNLISTNEILIDGVKTTFWTVEIAPGDFLQISERDVHPVGARKVGHDKLVDYEFEYVKKMRETEFKTAQDHITMASWCISKGLTDLGHAHFLQALDIDPDNGSAREGADYQRDPNGRWKKKAEVIGQLRGKVKVGRRYLFPEDVAIQQERDKAEEELKPIRKKMNTLHSALSARGSQRNQEQALATLQAIQDPREANILAEYLVDKRRMPPPPLRIRYINILSRFPNAIPALTNASLNDEDQNVRAAARDALRGLNAESSIPTFLGYLTSPNNSTVNRAARGIGLFNPPHAVLPLIEALVTTHEEERGGGNNVFNPQGGMQFGGSKKKVKVDKQNSAVLETLTAITNQRFDSPYNKKLWYAWYAATYAAPVADLRRDP
ncbi:MAG: HEAT repeat domain-containing protein [Planctomycetota bacterium]